MPTAEKAAVIDAMTEKLERAKGAVLLSTQGLTVAEITALRRRLSTGNVELYVVKNTLLRIATERAQFGDITSVLSGQTSIALGFEDEVAAAKLLTEYLRTARTGKPVTVKGGLLEKQLISPAQVEDLSKTPPRDELRALVVGSIAGPLNQTYSVLSAPLRDLVFTLDARIRQLGGEEAA